MDDSANQPLDSVLLRDSEEPQTLYELALAAQQEGRLPEAIRSLQIAIEAAPKVAVYHLALADAYRQASKSREAVEAYRQAILLAPNCFEAYMGMGETLKDLKVNETAAELLRLAACLRPDSALAHVSLGNTYIEMGKLDLAATSLRTAFRILRKENSRGADSSGHFYELGKHFEKRASSKEAFEFYEYALELNPQHAKANWGKGNIYYQRSEIEDALRFYRKAVEGEPENSYLHTNLALALLSDGQYKEGWSEFQWRLKIPEYPSRYRDSGRPHWDGSPLNGKTILLHAEQGLGDTIQFARFIPMVARLGGRVLLEVQPGLCKLLSQLAGVVQTIPQGSSLPAFSCYSSLMSLPHLLDITHENIPSAEGYLEVPADEIETVAKRWPGKRLRVGIVWGGSPQMSLHLLRSLPLKQLEPLHQVQDVSIYSLQVGTECRQLKDISSSFQVTDVCSTYEDFWDTAVFASGLDLVITVDTSVAHMAGSLGIPTWLMLPKQWSDWRWLHHRDTSPWYSSMRIFRQPDVGDWSGLVVAVQQELARLVTR